MVNVNQNGCYANYDPVTHKVTHYEVVFLDPHVMTIRRLSTLCIRKYTSGELIDEELRRSIYWRKIEKAISEAEHALKLPVHTRLMVYGGGYSEETRDSSEASQSLKHKGAAETRREKKSNCRTGHRRRLRKKKGGEALESEGLGSTNSLLNLNHEGHKAGRSSFTKVTQSKKSTTSSEESPSFLNPPAPEVFYAGVSQESIANAKSTDLSQQAGPSSGSSNSEFFATSLPQEGVTEYSSNTNFFPDHLEVPPSNLKEISLEYCRNVTPNLCQITISEDPNIQTSLPMKVDQNESIMKMHYVSSNLKKLSQEVFTKNSTFISDSSNRSSRVETIANRGELCWFINRIASNEVDLTMHDSTEDPNYEDSICRYSSNGISTTFSKDTVQEIQSTQNIEVCSMLGFLKQSIESRLEERAYLIKEISDRITNLPFHLQLKPVNGRTYQ